MLGPIGGEEFHLAQVVVEISGQCRAIRRPHEIVVEFFLLSAGLDLLFASVESLPVGLHARGEAMNEAPEGVHIGVKVLRAVGEAEEVVVVERVAHGGHERIDALDDVFVFRPAAARGECAEVGFFTGLDVEQAGGSDAGVHATEVFHHVAQTHIVVGILERHIFVAIHQRFHEAKFGISSEIDGLVDTFSAKAHLRCREIATRSARESHNHRIVVLVDAFQAHGQPFLALERLLVFRVCRRLSLSICIDAEHCKVSIVAWPNPVVLVKAKLSDLLWRIHHKAHVVIALFVEGIVTIAPEIRYNAEGYTAFFGKGFVLFEHLLGKWTKEEIALTVILIDFRLIRCSFHLIRHIYDAHDKGESEVGHGEFFGETLSKEPILQIVVLHGRHGMHVGESAVIVGEHESFGGHHLTCATSSETSDDIAQGRLRFVVEFARTDLQPCLFERIF